MQGPHSCGEHGSDNDRRHGYTATDDPLRPGSPGRSRDAGETSKRRAAADRRQKNPNLKRLGSSTTTTPLAPFPSKGSPVENQAGFLARGTRLLSAPSQGCAPQWSSQISFRSQLRGSDGFSPSSLLTASGCEATWLSSTRKLFCYPSVVSKPCQTDKNG